MDIDPAVETAGVAVPKPGLEIPPYVVAEPLEIVRGKRPAVGRDLPVWVRPDAAFERGHRADGVVQVHRRDGVVAAERQQIPVVVAYAQADAGGLLSVGRDVNTAASVVADPGHEDVLPLAHAEFPQRVVEGRSHAPDVLPQEVGVARPGEVVARAADEQCVGDGMACVDRGDDGLQVDLRARGAIQPHAITREQPRMAGMPMERHVGELHLFGCGQRDRTPFRPRRLPFQEPLDGCLRLRRQPASRPLQAGERCRDGAAAKRRSDKGNDVRRRLQLQARRRVDAAHRRPRDLPTISIRPRLEAEHLDRPGIAGNREVKARARALLPRREGPALAVGHAAMLLHGDVAFGVDPAVQKHRSVLRAFLVRGPERRVGQPGIPKRAIRERGGVMQRVELVQRAHVILEARHLELRQAGFRPARGPGETDE